MAHKTKRGPAKHADQPASRLIQVVLLSAGLLVLISVIGLGLYLRNRSGSPKPTGASASADEASTIIPVEYRQKLLGRWLRPDGGYVLTIQSIAEDGRMQATYANPNPINVARAEAKVRGGRIGLFVELRDRNYPGNYYTLVYDDGQDQFAGVYHHLGLHQQFDVSFTRIH